MPEGDVLQILLSHDRWATVQVLDACGGLPDEQFHRRFEIGPGSLHDTLTHVVGAIRTWTDTLAGAEPRPRPEGDGRRRTPGELRSMLEESSRELAAEAGRRPVGETVTRRLQDGRTLRFTRAAVLAHVATHGMHHRAQCLNMLRHLGGQSLPPSSVADWTMQSSDRALFVPLAGKGVEVAELTEPGDKPA
jgi:uncharacterized damage-inducible protein DinB